MSVDRPNAGKRIMAFLVDLLVLAVYAAIIFSAVTFLMPAGTREAYAQALRNPPLADLNAFLLVVLPFVLYFTILESGPRQASLGKRLLGLKVAGGSGRPGFGRTLLRNALKFAPWQMAHTAIFNLAARPVNPPAFYVWLDTASMALALFYLICLMVSQTGRTPYDWLSGTAVESKLAARPSR